MTSSATSGANMAGGPSQLSSSASKVGGGGETSMAPSETNLISLYGRVKVSKELPTAGPPVSKAIEDLHSKIEMDFLCGMSGVILSIILSATLIFLGVISLQGKVMFMSIPDLKSYAKQIPLV